jgi:hypothetical protein
MAAGSVKQPVTEARGLIGGTLLKDEHPHQLHCYYTVLAGPCHVVGHGLPQKNATGSEG